MLHSRDQGGSCGRPATTGHLCANLHSHCDYQYCRVRWGIMSESPFCRRLLRSSCHLLIQTCILSRDAFEPTLTVGMNLVQSIDTAKQVCRDCPTQCQSPVPALSSTPHSPVPQRTSAPSTAPHRPRPSLSSPWSASSSSGCSSAGAPFPASESRSAA